ncbi:MAG: hypothetical protein RIR00_997 [Pseudomonadota bacterium]|jgi:chemotaxis protein CheD
MNRPAPGETLYLQPGDVRFGDCHNRLVTLLGSCVSLVFWHPRERLGGMCHYLLPSRQDRRAAGQRLDGRYGDEAIALLLQLIAGSGTRPADYRVHLYGGGDMFPDLNSRKIGHANVALARQLIQTYGLNCVASHVRGVGHRHLHFDIQTGRITLKRGHHSLALSETDSLPPPELPCLPSK